MDITIIVVFLALNLFIGLLASKNIKSFDRFSVGHRAFTSFAIFASLSASFIGGGYTLGNASKVYSYGMIYAFALLGFSLKEILVAFVIAPRMKAYQNSLSIGDIIAKRYGTGAKIMTGIFGVLVCTGILGAQVGAMGAVFNTFLHIKAFWGIIIGFSIIILYASLGGMRAVVYTDILQFLVLVIGIPLTLFIGIHHIGGMKVLMDKVPHDRIAFLSNKHNIFLFISLFVTFIFGETLVPPYVQRLFMAKSLHQTKSAILASGLLSIPFFLVAGAIGLVAYTMNPSINANSALPYVIDHALPVAVRGFVVASLIAIIMSSAAGFLNAASVSFVNDIVRPLTKDKSSQKTLMRLAKSVTFLVGVGSVIFALAIKNLLDVLLYAYNFWSPIILVPLVAAILNINTKKQDFFFGAVGGIIFMLLWLLVLHKPYGISPILVGILGNLIFFTTSYLIPGSKKTEVSLHQN